MRTMWRHIVHPYVGAYEMNQRLPFFVEVCENTRNVSAEPRLCQKVMTHLFRQRILLSERGQERNDRMGTVSSAHRHAASGKRGVTELIRGATS